MTDETLKSGTELLKDVPHEPGARQAGSRS